LNNPAEKTFCGYVALLGPPNAGKSSLLNALMGEKVAIVAPKPQTTRIVVRGVLNDGPRQAVLVDTPGLLQGGNALEWGMRAAALETLKDADLVLALVSKDTAKAWENDLPELPAGKIVVVATKCDLEGGEAAAEALAAPLAARIGTPRWLAVSATKGRNLDILKGIVLQALPEGPWSYIDDELSDQTLRQAAAEFVREQALLAAHDEVPHSIAVGVDTYTERPDGIHEVHVTLYVEREGQKAIIIGQGGERLKLIGTRARHQLERLAQAKVFLKLWVKVEKDWKKNPRFLKDLGYPNAKAPHGTAPQRDPQAPVPQNRVKRSGPRPKRR
jgi:GTP-binding protein Era